MFRAYFERIAKRACQEGSVELTRAWETEVERLRSEWHSAALDLKEIHQKSYRMVQRLQRYAEKRPGSLANDEPEPEEGVGAKEPVQLISRRGRT